MRPYILAETNYKALLEEEYEIAILPWGATEAHNLHMPYGTDSFESDFFAAEGARLAREEGAKCLVLPNMPFGVNTGQTDIPGTINLYPSTQANIVHDILESIEAHDIQKVLLLNIHCGNDVKEILREAGRDFPDMLLITANWFQSVDKSLFFENEGDHADEMETSLMLHLKPELILPLEEAGSGEYKTFASAALNEKWAWSERKWTKVTADTGIGNPKKATAEKGKAYFEAVSRKVADLLIQISEADPEDPYS
jgi:creatinine amidohydrolase